MILYFIRHGETVEGAQGRILGAQGGHLSSAGIAYAQEVAKYFTVKRIPITKIITSDLQRAMDTATIIGETLALPVETDPLIRERGAGEAEGKLEAAIDWQTYERQPLEQRKHQGGESFLDVRKRAESFVNHIRKQNQQGNVLVVSHAAFLLMLLSVLKDTSIERELKTDVARTVFKVDPERKTVEAFILLA